MNSKLYDLMNWPEIEAVVYSECEDPGSILGAHITDKGVLVQAFFPDAVKVILCIPGADNNREMEMVDEAGFFAALVPGKKLFEYIFSVTYEDGSENEVYDPYSFKPLITKKDLQAFTEGDEFKAYDLLGAHEAVVNGVVGVRFAVWAPNVLRISVVGDFNNWDGRIYPMRPIEDTGVYEIFLPNVKNSDIYKYELRIKGGALVLKADPYAFAGQLRPDNASVVCNIENYKWKDRGWLEKRRQADYDKLPVSIYELHLGSFEKPDDGREFYNYRELAKKVCSYVKKMGYTHIEVMPVMEYPFDASWGYQVTGYFAPTSRYGTPQDFMYFVDYMHSNNIGVILDWVPAHFPKDLFGLARFDGTCLYEHLDKRQGEHPDWGTLIFNYKRPQVSNFLASSAAFWTEKYHVDGIRMDAVASMLYLDYGRKPGEWIPNIYGGKENLDAVEFLKKVNGYMEKNGEGALMIAEESTAWPKVTGSIKEDSLGFNYKWNMGWMNDFLDYMSCDPLFRHGKYNELIFSMIYAYSENFILVLSHDEVVHGKGTMLGKMPGITIDDKFSNLRAAYGFMYAHPGKKLLFMGQDIAQFNEWNEEKSVEWGSLELDRHKQMQNYVRDLNKLYTENKSLYEFDFEPEGFEWINNFSAEESTVVFARKADEDDFVVVVANFDTIARKDYKIGVLKAGEYKEIFNSDKKSYGGTGMINRRAKIAKADECDGREYSIRVNVPALSVMVFKYGKPKETKE